MLWLLPVSVTIIKIIGNNIFFLFRLQEIEGEFEKHVSVHDITQCRDVDNDGILYVYNYWVLKRRSGNNRALLAQKSDDCDLLGRQQEQADLDKLKMFVQLRQDLERVNIETKMTFNLKITIIFIYLLNLFWLLGTKFMLYGQP